MANKYEKVEWEDRQSQYPNRRKMIPTEIENVYEVERAEGEVTEPGNAFDAANMNGLEDRVYSAFDTLDSSDIRVLDKGNHFVATDLEGVLGELFTSASNGKTAIATAIGSPASSSDSFAQLASKITAGKGQIASAIGETRNGAAANNESFQRLSDRVKNDKKSFYNGKITITPALIGGDKSYTQKVQLNLGFLPSYVFLWDLSYSYKFIDGNGASTIQTIRLDNNLSLRGTGFIFGLVDPQKTGFTLKCLTGNSVENISINSTEVDFIAIS